ncbi:MAG: hypothetical protein ACI9EF_001351, partial [Pseudohongiellaceae bacterium]
VTDCVTDSVTDSVTDCVTDCVSARAFSRRPSALVEDHRQPD